MDRVCATCTYENGPFAARCEVCEAAAPSAAPAPDTTGRTLVHPVAIRAVSPPGVPSASALPSGTPSSSDTGSGVLAASPLAAAPPASHDDPPVWECGACTFVNVVTDPVCCCCETPKLVAAPPVAAAAAAAVTATASVDAPAAVAAAVDATAAPATPVVPPAVLSDGVSGSETSISAPAPATAGSETSISAPAPATAGGSAGPSVVDAPPPVGVAVAAVADEVAAVVAVAPLPAMDGVLDAGVGAASEPSSVQT